MSTNDWEELLSDPESKFASPRILAADGELPADRKIELLEAWERNTRQLMVGEGEGLGAESSDAGEMLQQIHEAMESLGHPHDPTRAQTDVSGSSS